MKTLGLLKAMDSMMDNHVKKGEVMLSCSGKIALHVCFFVMMYFLIFCNKGGLVPAPVAK